MIDGITILDIGTEPTYFYGQMVLAIFLIIVGIAIIIFTKKYDGPTTAYLFGALIIIVFTILLIIIITSSPSNSIIYTVQIKDSVSFNEVYQNYEIISYDSITNTYQIVQK